MTLKYRAWDTIDNRMIYDGDSIRRNGKRSYSVIVTNHGVLASFPLGKDPAGRDWEVKDDNGNRGYAKWEYERLIFVGFELNCSTGLHDRNGVEIFEGDVLGLEPLDGPDTVRCSVVYEPPSFMRRYGGCDEYVAFNAPFDTWDKQNWIVIGNRFANPELLTQR